MPAYQNFFLYKDDKNDQDYGPGSIYLSELICVKCFLNLWEEKLVTVSADGYSHPSFYFPIFKVKFYLFSCMSFYPILQYAS